MLGNPDMFIVDLFQISLFSVELVKFKKKEVDSLELVAKKEFQILAG